MCKRELLQHVEKEKEEAARKARREKGEERREVARGYRSEESRAMEPTFGEQFIVRKGERVSKVANVG